MELSLTYTIHDLNDYRGTCLLIVQPENILIIGTREGVLLNYSLPAFIKQCQTETPASPVTCLCLSRPSSFWAGISNQIQEYSFTFSHFRTLKIHNDSITSLHLCKDSLLSSSEDGCIKLYDLKTESETPVLTQTESILAFDFCENLNLMAFSTNDSIFRMKEVDSQISKLKQVDEKIWSIKFWKNEYVFTGDHLGAIKLWKIEDFELITTISAHDSRIKCIALNEEEKLIATGSYDQSVNVYELNGFEKVSRYQHKDWVRDVKFDNTRVLSVADDKTLGVWEVENKTKKEKNLNLMKTVEAVKQNKIVFLVGGVFLLLNVCFLTWIFSRYECKYCR